MAWRPDVGQAPLFKVTTTATNPDAIARDERAGRQEAALAEAEARADRQRHVLTGGTGAARTMHLTTTYTATQPPVTPFAPGFAAAAITVTTAPAPHISTTYTSTAPSLPTIQARCIGSLSSCYELHQQQVQIDFVDMARGVLHALDGTQWDVRHALAIVKQWAHGDMILISKNRFGSFDITGTSYPRDQMVTTYTTTSTFGASSSSSPIVVMPASATSSAPGRPPVAGTPLRPGETYRVLQ